MVAQKGLLLSVFILQVFLQPLDNILALIQLIILIVELILQFLDVVSEILRRPALLRGRRHSDEIVVLVRQGLLVEIDRVVHLQSEEVGCFCFLLQLGLELCEF